MHHEKHMVTGFKANKMHHWVKEISYFIHQGCIKLLKSDSKDIYVTKDLYFK